MRSLVHLLALLSFASALGCGGNKPPATVYVTVPQTVAKPTTEGSASKATAASEKKAPEKVVGEKAEKLKKLDKDAMATLRRGDYKGCMQIWSDVAKEYRKTTPADCSPEESLALAVVYARILYLLAKANQPEDEVTLSYAKAGRAYALKGGVKPDQFEDWSRAILNEMDEAAGAKK